MHKRRFSVWEWGLFIVPLVLLVLPFLLRLDRSRTAPVKEFFQPVQKERRASCQRNLESISLAIAQYTKDYDGKFPPAVVGGLSAPSLSSRFSGAGGTEHRVWSGIPVGWADALQTHLGGIAANQCPNEPTPPSGKPTKSGYVDFWFNANLSGASKKSLAFPAATLLLGEGSDGKDITDATYSKSSLPSNWLTDTSSPMYRHLGGANYLMADGSVHWLKPNEVLSFGGRKNSFAIK